MSLYTTKSRAVFTQCQSYEIQMGAAGCQRVFENDICPATGSCGQPTTKPPAEAENLLEQVLSCVARDFQMLGQTMQRFVKHSLSEASHQQKVVVTLACDGGFWLVY
jgi:hypothetical protein